MRKPISVTTLIAVAPLLLMVGCTNPQFAWLSDAIAVEVGKANFSGPLLEVYHGETQIQEAGFVDLFVGQTAETAQPEVLRIRNGGNETLTLGTIGIDNQDFTVSEPQVNVLGQGIETEISITLNEGSPINRQVEFLISSDAATQENFRFFIRVDGEPSTVWSPLASGAAHAIAVDASGNVWAWGDNESGQLGDGSFADRDHPVMLGGLANAVSVSAGSNHSLAILADGTVWSWGANDSGQLGNGTTDPSNEPVQVLGLTAVIAAASGYAHNVALLEDGSVMTWGSNSSGQLGDGTRIQRESPVLVGTIDGVEAVDADADFSAALSNPGGSLWVWGDNTSGQLGDGTDAESLTPKFVAGIGGGYPVGAFATGTTHMLAIVDWQPHAFGANYGPHTAWGVNTYGQFGDNSYVPSSTPIPPMSGWWFSATAGAGFSVVMDDSGVVSAWGRNDYGQLGDGSFDPRPAGVTIATAGTYDRVVAGENQAYALTSTGIVYSWGFNDNGQLGDGSLVNRETQSPVLTSGLQPFSLAP